MKIYFTKRKTYSVRIELAPVLVFEYSAIGIVVKFRFWYKANLSELILPPPPTPLQSSDNLLMISG